MKDKQHHDLLFNSKIHTINILNLVIITLRDNDSIYQKYICHIINIIKSQEPYSLMLSSILENSETIDKFIKHWYYKIYKHTPILDEFGSIFGMQSDQRNINKRIEFLEEIIKQLNKQSKNKKS